MLKRLLHMGRSALSSAAWVALAIGFILLIPE
jgi:hypothetical protein